MNSAKDTTLATLVCSKRQRLFLLLLLLLPILASYLGWRFIHSSMEKQARLIFENDVNKTVFLIQKKVEIYLAILNSAQHLFVALRNVKRDEWAAFIDPEELKTRYPGITAMRFVERVDLKDKGAFIESVRSDVSLLPAGYPNFDIRPEGDRKEYFVVKYVQPYAGNEKMLGFDVNVKEIDREALLRARDTGDFAATRRTALQSLGETDPAFHIYLPIYRINASVSTVEGRRAALVGFVDAVFRAKELFSNIFEQGMTRPEIDFEIFDGVVSEDNLLYNDASILDAIASNPHMPFTQDVTIKVAGRPWIIRFVDHSRFVRTPLEKELSVIVFVGGVFFSALIGVVVWLLASARSRALNLANKMTVELRREMEERKKAEEQVWRAAVIKSEFTSMVSHELRTPLTVIKESIRIVQSGTAGAINCEQESFLVTAKRNIDRLTRLINDVLDFQKFESKQMEIHMRGNDINALVSETKENFALTVKNKDLALSVDLEEVLPHILFDRDQIAQVLTNLVGNAIAVMEKGKIILKTRRLESAVRVSVEDQGLGIKEEDLPKLFQPFSQLFVGNERKTGATGLGLAISKKIIDAHHGQIGVESVYGKGATFYFLLPIKERRIESEE